MTVTKWREANREREREYQRAYYQEHREQQIAASRSVYQRRRRQVLEYYSGGEPVCACCGETIYEFLVLDHANNDGSEHKRSAGGPLRSGNHTYLWVIQHDFPDGFQVLCNNCNCAKFYHGVCPHQRSQ